MLAVAFGLLLAASATPPARRNILYLIAGEDPSPPAGPPGPLTPHRRRTADDFRPEMFAAYNQSHLRTPAFDALAAGGLTFQYAYANQAVYATPDPTPGGLCLSSGGG